MYCSIFNLKCYNYKYKIPYEDIDYNIKRLKLYSSARKSVYYYNYKRRHTSLSIDERPAVTPSMAYEEKVGNLNVKEQ